MLPRKCFALKMLIFMTPKLQIRENGGIGAHMLKHNLWAKMLNKHDLYFQTYDQLRLEMFGCLANHCPRCHLCKLPN